MSCMDYLQIRVCVCGPNSYGEWPFLLQVSWFPIQVHWHHRHRAWPAQDLPLQGLGGDPKRSHTPWIGWAAGPTAVGAARARGELLSAWSSTSSAPPPPAGCFEGKGRCFLQSLPAIPCLGGGWGSEEKPDGWLCFPGHPLAAQNPVMQFPGRLSDE